MFHAPDTTDCPAPPAATAPGGRADWHVATIDTLSGLDALRPEWEALHARDPHSGLYLSHGWLRALIRRVEPDWRVYTVRRGGADGPLVCLWPALLKPPARPGGPERLSQLGRATISDRTGFVCDPELAEPALAALGRHLAEQDWSDMSIRYEPTHERVRWLVSGLPRDRFEARWHEQRINGGTTDTLVSPAIALPDSFETYLAQCLGRDTRSAMTRALRRYIDSGVCRITMSGPETLARDIAILAALWSDQWARTYDERVISRSIRRHRRFFALAEKLDALRIWVLWQGDEPIGAHARILDRKSGVMLAKQGARRLDVRPPVGNLLFMHEIRWAIENGIATFDLGHGDDRYKFSLGARPQRLGYATITRRPER